MTDASARTDTTTARWYDSDNLVKILCGLLLAFAVYTWNQASATLNEVNKAVADIKLAMMSVQGDVSTLKSVASDVKSIVPVVAKIEASVDILLNKTGMQVVFPKGVQPESTPTSGTFEVDLPGGTPKKQQHPD